MKKLLTTFSVCVFILSQSGCTKVDSNDLKDDVPYYQAYSVLYSKVEDVTRVSAYFRVREANGARVKLSNGSTITANGTAGNASNPFDPTLYSWQFNGLQKVDLVLTRSGKGIANTIRLSDIGGLDFPSGFATVLHKNADYSFNWAGDALAKGEHLYVGVSGTSVADSTLNASTEKEVTGSVATITTADMKDIRPGVITVSLRRDRNLDLDTKDGTSGGDKQITISTSREISLQ